MLARFAITPGAFEPANATSPNAFDAGMGCLQDLCRDEALFLDLRDGAWGAALDATSHAAREFRMFAHGRHRLVREPVRLHSDPDDDEGWLWEAQAVHEQVPCRAIITHHQLAGEYREVTAIASMERLNSATWWAERSPSLAVHRQTSAYLDALGLVLRHANLLMFIDGNIDPRANNYREFPRLLLAAGSQQEQPLIEIHRASWRRVGREKGVQPLAQWKADFEAWSEELNRAGRRAEVFLWEDVHDRYLVSDIVAVNLPYGFDIAAGDRAPTTWCRVGRQDQERLQREYDPNSRLRRFVNRFQIGAA